MEMEKKLTVMRVIISGTELGEKAMNCGSVFFIKTSSFVIHFIHAKSISKSSL